MDDGNDCSELAFIKLMFAFIWERERGEGLGHFGHERFQSYNVVETLSIVELWWGRTGS